MSIKVRLSKAQFVKNALRRASYKWPPRTESLRKARVGRGDYLCNLCKKIFKRKEVQVDHIIPVIDPLTGFNGFDEYVERLLCDEDNFQVICISCHKTKTLEQTKEAVAEKNRKKITKKRKKY